MNEWLLNSSNKSNVSDYGCASNGDRACNNGDAGNDGNNGCTSSYVSDTGDVGTAGDTGQRDFVVES